MGKIVINNPGVFIIWALLFIAGYCFGGINGVGIAALIILLIQILL